MSRSARRITGLAVAIGLSCAGGVISAQGRGGRGAGAQAAPAPAIPPDAKLPGPTGIILVFLVPGSGFQVGETRTWNPEPRTLNLEP